MFINYIHTFIKFLGINLCIYYTYIKIANFYGSKLLNKFNTIIVFIICINISFLQAFFQNNFSTLFRILIMYFIYSLILGKLTQKKLSYSSIITILSISISYIVNSTSAFFTAIILAIFKEINYTNPIYTIIIIGIDFIILKKLFLIKRFKNGFPFLTNNNKNEIIDIIVFPINIIIIFMYFLLENHNNLTLQNVTITFFLFALFMIPTIQKTFILYQKQKLLNKTLKEYETELAETKTKLETALQEKHNLVKSNHEFYHRQEALKQKLNNLLQSNNNEFLSETSKEYSDILDRINTLSEEYTSQIKTRPLLPKTNITELDDMFSYFQYECEKYDIDLILKINADISHMIETAIPKNKLETLIGDLLRNAIIAINHNNNSNKSIMAILGIKDNCYEFCVHDSGIEFEISTLLKLGNEPASTHLEDGGTGIGFITTFETLNYCNASLIINENISNSNIYTKSIVVKFDNSNKYIINSYRSEEISNLNKTRNNIIINNLEK